MKKDNIREVLEEVFLEAAPYLHDISKVKSVIEEKLSSASTLKSIIVLLEDLIDREDQEYRRTDYRILLDYLKSRLNKGGEVG